MVEAVLIQIARVCNLRCRMCGWTAWQRNRGFMSAELYAHVLGEIKAAGISRVHLTNPQGEPLLHPQAIEFIRAAIREFDVVHLNTNITPLTEPKIAALADFAHSGRFAIQASFSGYDEPSHESVYVGSQFSATSEKLRRLIAAVPPHALTILGTIYDATEKERHVEYLLSLGGQRDRITMQLPDNFAGYADHAESSFKGELRELTMCHLLAHYLLVYDDGKMSACACRDSEGVMEIGDLTKESLSAIMAGPRYQGMLEAFRRKDLSNMPLCQKCDIPYGDPDSLRL